MTCFLTSSPFLEEENRLNPANGLLEELRQSLKPKCRALFICSNPEGHERTVFFAQAVREAFEADGFSFSGFEILDGRNRDRADELVKASAFIVLAGGHVPTQNRFFHEIGLRDLLQGFDGVILGISAGTMNAAETVYAQPEEEGEAIDPGYQRFLPGLGLTKVQILPHYQSTRHDVLDGLRVFEDIAYPDSMGRAFYALPDGSYLLIREGGEELRGEAFLIRDGTLCRICKNGESLEPDSLRESDDAVMEAGILPEKLVTMKLPYPGRKRRTVRVFVPARKRGERLPVIYMSDGQNLFDKETSSFGCWYVREAMREERKSSGKAAIIVGIHNEDPERMDDLTPQSIGELFPEEAREGINPKGEAFADFLLHTVKPAVEKRFPVKIGRENCAFCGSSAGGMMAFFLALRYPEVFSHAGVLSPAFFLYSREDLEAWVLSVMREEKPFLYLYTGEGDPIEKEICRSFRAMCDSLDPIWPQEKMVQIQRTEQIHHEEAWEPEFQVFLHRFLNG